MNLIIDNIVFSLQKAGGISTLWGELIKSVENKNSLETSYLEYSNAEENIVRKELLIRPDQVINSNGEFLSLQLERFLSPNLSNANNKFLFFSSYYRTSSTKNAVNVTLVHDFTHEHYHKGIRRYIHSWQKGQAVKKADGIICISENTKKDLLHFYPKTDLSKIKVIYNGVADHFFQIPEKVKWTEIDHQLGNLEQSKIILFVGSRAGYKNFTLALDAVALLSSDYHLIIIGSPLTNIEQTEIHSKLKNNNFTVFSNIDNKTLNKIYNKSYILLYPSSYEGFGIPVLEAMKAGIPVIAQKTSSIPEVAGDAGVLVESPSPESIKKEILRLEDENYYQDIVEKGLKQAMKFSWKKTMDNYVEFFAHLYNMK